MQTTSTPHLTVQQPQSKHRQQSSVGAELGGITFAVNGYQDHACYAARSFANNGLPMTVVLGKHDKKDKDLPWPSTANVIKSPHESFKTFDYEQYAYDLSPYQTTIKVDSDLYLPLGYTLPESLEHLDLVTGHPYTLFGERSGPSIYRNHWRTELSLPEIYSAFFLFRKGFVAEAFFGMMKQVTRNWPHLAISKYGYSTDLIYSIAWYLTEGPSLGPGLPFIHMKSNISGIETVDDWTTVKNTAMFDGHTLTVNGVVIDKPFHYYDKAFVKLLEERCSSTSRMVTL